MNADGSNVVQLTTEVGIDQQPTWSADGSKIIYSTERAGNFEIFTMNPDGTGKTNVSNAAGEDTRPAYTRRVFMGLASTFAWTSTRDGNREIYVAGTAGAPIRLTNNPATDENAVIR
jgi:Tol biopolymer transport system component